MLGESQEEINEIIDLIKAKELSQATLGEVEKRKNQKQKQKQNVEPEELTDEENVEEHNKWLHEMVEEDNDNNIEEDVEVMQRNKRGKSKVKNI